MKDLKLISQQLRKPSGDFAGTIAEKMGKGNRPLYELTFDSISFQDRDTILEIGYGSGIHFPELLSGADHLQVSGIDYSPEMTDLAKSGNKELIDSGRLKLYTGNSNQLPFDDYAFDIVFCNMVIYFWDNPDDHLKEINRVLKPGGRFYTGMRTRESMQQLPFTKYGFRLFSVDEWVGLLKKSNFITDEVHRKTDPEFHENGKLIRLESVCISAEKANG